MHEVIDIIQRALHSRWSFGAVCLIALVLAWLDRASLVRRMRGYDAWWFVHLPRSDTKMLGRRSKRS